MRSGIKIGELAKRTGVSVRALRHYDEIGLLRPLGRSEGNQRLYSGAEVARLQRIVALRQLGFGLNRIGALLDGDGVDAVALIDAQRESLRARIVQLERLTGLLDAARRDLELGQNLDVDRMIALTEMTTMVERHYTEGQRAFLAQRRRELGDDRIADAEAAWPELIEEVLAAMDSGVPATAPEALELAARWRALIEAFSGGDAGIERTLGTVWEQDGDRLVQEHGLNPRMPEAFAYIQQALTRG